MSLQTLPRTFFESDAELVLKGSGDNVLRKMFFVEEAVWQRVQRLFKSDTRRNVTDCYLRKCQPERKNLIALSSVKNKTRSIDWDR